MSESSLVEVEKIFGLEESSDLIDGVFEIWEGADRKSPNVPFGVYRNYFFVTVKEGKNLLSFINEYGQILMIPRFKCSEKTYLHGSSEIKYYYCSERPIISFDHQDLIETKIFSHLASISNY